MVYIQKKKKEKEGQAGIQGPQNPFPSTTIFLHLTEHCILTSLEVSFVICEMGTRVLAILVAGSREGRWTKALLN